MAMGLATLIQVIMSKNRWFKSWEEESLLLLPLYFCMSS